MTNQYNDNEDNFAKNPLNKKTFKKSAKKDKEEKTNEMIDAEILSKQNKFKIINNAIKDLVIKTKIKSKSVDHLITKMSLLSLTEKILNKLPIEQNINNEKKKKIYY